MLGRPVATRFRWGRRAAGVWEVAISHSALVSIDVAETSRADAPAPGLALPALQCPTISKNAEGPGSVDCVARRNRCTKLGRDEAVARKVATAARSAAWRPPSTEVGTTINLNGKPQVTQLNPNPTAVPIKLMSQNEPIAPNHILGQSRRLLEASPLLTRDQSSWDQHRRRRPRK